MSLPTTDFPYIKGEIAEDIACITLIQTDEDHEPYQIYIYLAIRGDKLNDFQMAHKVGNYNPSHYGIILEYGYGTPPDEIKKKMHEKYGFDHNSMVVAHSEGKNSHAGF